MSPTITGEIAQTARLDLTPGEELWISKGSLMAYTPGVRWRVKVPGGIGGAFRRSLSGEGVSLVQVTTEQTAQTVHLAAGAPGKLVEWDLADGAVLTTRGSFLAAWGPGIDIDVTVAKRAGAAFFGGAGLFLQKVSGVGRVLVQGSGDFVDRRLGPGEQLLVSTGNLAAFAGEVDYDIQGVSGIRNALFGSEGLFMTRLQGPGRILLQTLKRTHGKASE